MFTNIKLNQDVQRTSSELTADVYNNICNLHYSYVNDINYRINDNLYIHDDDTFHQYVYDLTEDTYSRQTSYIYDVHNSEAFNITVYNSNIICDFISPVELSCKLKDYSNRYYPLEVNLEYDIESHSVVFIFDTSKHKCYIIDTNCNLNFCDYSYDGNSISYYLHKIFKHYARGIGYKYKNVEHLDFNINYKLESQHQKSFFDGYCRAWSFYFILLLTSEENINLIKYIKELRDTDIEQLNIFIEQFQAYYHSNYINL